MQNTTDALRPNVREVIRIQMPTEHGLFDLVAFDQEGGGTLFALTKGEWTAEDDVLVRVHSSCITGDILGSLRCDCGPQLEAAMKRVQEEGRGVVLYVEQEGRGIGFLNKMKAYRLQEQGRDTVEANLELGFEADQRDYTAAAEALRLLKVERLCLLSNNPAKPKALKALGLKVVKILALEIDANDYNDFYLKTKRDKMGHILHQSHLK